MEQSINQSCADSMLAGRFRLFANLAKRCTTVPSKSTQHGVRYRLSIVCQSYIETGRESNGTKAGLSVDLSGNYWLLT